MTEPRQLRSALFVDFDNIYITLQQQDPRAADTFAHNPEQWLRWLEYELPHPFGNEGAIRRRILIRRCYLNPQSFSMARPYFIRAAFEVIDCPPLTIRGKTAADIHMVMDILDTLQVGSPIDEFILLSGDADFTPVLLRLRRNDRTCAILSVGYASPAYRAASDLLIPTDDFLTGALGISELEEPPAPLVEPRMAPSAEGVLDDMAQRLWEAAQQPNGIQASDLPSVYKEFPTFRSSTQWLGFGSLRRLTEALCRRRPELQIIEEDPWRVSSRGMPSRHSSEQEQPAPAPGNGLRDELAEIVRQQVGESSTPVSWAALAHTISTRFQPQIAGTNWLGAGTFKGLLSSLDLNPLEMFFQTPGYVYDPQRHAMPVAAGPAAQLSPQAIEFASRYPAISSVAEKVHQLTDTPYLLPEHYAILLDEVAREINERGFQLTQTSKTVRDRCVEKGVPAARAHVNFVLIGLTAVGHHFVQGEERAAQLGEELVGNILNLCRGAQLVLSEEEIGLLRAWIVGAIPSQRPEPA